MHGSISKALRSPALRNLFSLPQVKGRNDCPLDFTGRRKAHPPSRCLLEGGVCRGSENSSGLGLDSFWARKIPPGGSPWKLIIPRPLTPVSVRRVCSISRVLRAGCLGWGRGGEGACPRAPAWRGGHGPSARTEQLGRQRPACLPGRLGIQLHGNEACKSQQVDMLENIPTLRKSPESERGATLALAG